MLEISNDLIHMASIDRFNSDMIFSLQNAYVVYWENEIRNIYKAPYTADILLKTVYTSETYLSINMDTAYTKIYSKI